MLPKAKNLSTFDGRVSFLNENQVVCVESLKVKNMIRNPKLSKRIADVGWGRFVKMLAYKADWGG